MSYEENIQLAINNATTLQLRFHYRHVASDLAWDAAQLMPRNSDQLASLLCEAGGWLKNDAPASADRFYKSLVTRTGQTSLGRSC